VKGGCPDVPVSRKWWVATRTYTAICLDGKVGDPVTVTRQARSYVSQEDADFMAAHLAECEAKAELQCYFEASASVLTNCSMVDPAQLITETAQSEISAEDAYEKALAAAQATVEILCTTGFGGGELDLFSVAGIPIFSMGGQQITTHA